MMAWDGDAAGYEELIDALNERGEPAVAALDRRLYTAVDWLWEHGWTPADAVHVISRELSAVHGDVVAALVIADGQRRVERGQVLHPRWEAQLAALGERDGAGRLPLRADRLRLGTAVLCVLNRMPDVPRTVPQPGATGGVPLSGRLDARVLARVRALLAKAESTEFDEEAEALTAKAQELIARHAIDDALLHEVDDIGEPSVRRIPVGDPYAEAKASLLSAIAGANRCQVVYDAAFGWVTAFGYDHDLDAVELLSASLLAQATSAMARHGSYRDAAGRSRTRSFRRAFLFGFAYRIGQRLRAATDGQVAAAAKDEGRLLPVLSAREDRLREAVRTTFPHVERRKTSVSHAGGWAAGRAAAELADLNLSVGALDGREPPA